MQKLSKDVEDYPSKVGDVIFHHDIFHIIAFSIEEKKSKLFQEMRK